MPNAIPLYFEYILGKLADFETEELLFTEEELLERVEEVLELRETNNYEDENVFTEQNVGCDTANSLLPTTMLPLYSDDGGIAVTIKNFAAVSRNTKHPEEAYEFLDFFMREKTQLASYVYAAFSFAAVPIYDQAYKEGYPFFHKTLTDEGYAEFAEFKEQITSVNFNNDLVKDLALMITDCWNANKEGLPYEEIVHNAYEQMQRKIKE